MSRAATGRGKASRNRYTSRPVLWALRRTNGLYETMVFGTRQAAVFRAAQAMDGLVVVPLYAKLPARR